ncbi:MAG: PilN domain-containing protein [Bacillota bacterium]|jgi:methyl-accepting chemotaxis protein
MSVIFKEKHYDQLSILLKNIAVVIIVLLILLTGFNFFFKNKIEVLSSSLENLSREELKYEALIDNSKNKHSQIAADKYSNLLIKLAQYAEKIRLNSIYYKDKKINLNAVSMNQKDIFELIENLKADKSFSEVKLLNINHRDYYYFQLELINLQ